MSEPAIVDMADAEFWADPYTPLASARERCPIALSPGGQRMLLRYADVDRLLRDTRMRALGTALLTSVKIKDGPLYDWWRLVMFNTNPPEHTRLRKLVSAAFTRRSTEAMRPRIRQLAAELIDSRAAAGQIEFVSEFAHRLPIGVMCELLGVPTTERDALTEWTSELGLVFSTVMPPDLRERLEGAIRNVSACVEKLIAERRKAPREDLLSDLIAAEDAGDRLSPEELVAMVINLLFAGHDTTRSLLSIGMALLLDHPDQLSRLRADPSLLPSAVEEMLRYEAPVLGSLRAPATDMELDGIPLAAGRPVYMIFPAANRDPRQFSEPDRFSIDRDEGPPLSFGAGTHYCLGAALARAEAQEALGLVLARCLDIESRIDAVEWVPFASARRIRELPLAFKPA